MLKPKQSRHLSAGGDHAMTNSSTNSPALQSQAETAGHLLDDWFDPIEAGLRDWVRQFIQGMIEAEDFDPYLTVLVVVDRDVRLAEDRMIFVG